MKTECKHKWVKTPKLISKYTIILSNLDAKGSLNF
jgi:hypothetical protein